MFVNLGSLIDNTPIANTNTNLCVEHRQPPKPITFSVNGTRTVLRGNCINHLNNCTIYNGLDIQTGELFAIKEWIVSGTDAKQGQKIIEHLDLLIHLKHENLAKLENFTYVAADNKLIVYILQEFVFGANCLKFFIKTFPIHVLRYIASGILHSFDFLCINNIMCPNLKDTCICINSNGDIKLMNYEININFINTRPLAYTKKKKKKKTMLEQFYNENMYNFGTVLLSLFMGKAVKLNITEIPETVPSILNDFLVTCSTNNEGRQIVTELLNHSFIKGSSDFTDSIKIPGTSGAKRASKEFNQAQSRVKVDFEILELLGEGGFGKVYKAKKILDGRVYALKKIKLSYNKKSNYKLLKEVQHLSMFDHENIVRYYSSWTEVEDITTNDEESQSSDLYDSEDAQYNMDDKTEVNYKSINNEYAESPNSGLNDYCNIVKDTQTAHKVHVDEVNESPSKDSSIQSSSKQNNIMLVKHPGRNILYIQMEFYEGNTLQNVIESNELHWDTHRISKFLRELVEGIAYIHQQGIIHRDLKPLNIFLDSDDHIKIGDFGLATSNIRYKRTDRNNQSNEGSAREGLEYGSSTREVGTVYYKAPELTSNIRICNEKLDMYSLGIIIFEMCYERPNTASERHKILTNLRLQNIVFPENFNYELHHQRQVVIRKLLNHNPLIRPTSHELLESKCVPPIVEEKKQQQLFKYVIDNPHLKLYKYLMEICFHQTNKCDYNFDNSVFQFRNVSKMDYVTNCVTEIFKLHGGQNFRMPAVMSQNGCYDGCQYCVKLMTRTGKLVVIPCNNRVPFIRHLAMNEDLTWIRRYSTEKIKKPTRLSGEVYECVFDIITPNNFRNDMLDAEILKVLSEIKDSLLDLKPDGFYINLNHSLLLNAILLECDISDSHENYAIIIKILKHVTGISKSSFLHRFLPENVTCKLVKLTEICSSTPPRAILRYFTNTVAKDMAYVALQDLSRIVTTAKMFTITCPIRVMTGLMHNFEQHSGILIEFVYKSRNKRHVLAAGGRYDASLNRFLNSTSIPETIQEYKYGVGISVHLEVLCNLLENQSCGINSEVVICSFSEEAVSPAEVEISEALQLAGISCSFINVAKKTDLRKWCTKNGVSRAILINKKDIRRGVVTLIKWKCRGNMTEEIEVNVQEIVDVLKYSTNQEHPAASRLTESLLNSPSTSRGRRVKNSSSV